MVVLLSVKTILPIFTFLSVRIKVRTSLTITKQLFRDDFP
nr:MAG TPA: hypothetical protein [Caudoviricetes sp.]